MIEVSGEERNGNRDRDGRRAGTSQIREFDKVPTVAPDIPVIHRLVTENFASATRKRCAWCSCDRDGGSGLIQEPATAGGRGRASKTDQFPPSRRGRDLRRTRFPRREAGG